MLRAIRRPKASGTPRRMSKGSTVIASAPPTPAANPATVVRSRFTEGSWRVVIGSDVTAWTAAGAAGSVAPDSRPIRVQSTRAARSFAMEVNCSSVTARRSSSRRSDVSIDRPAASNARRYCTPAART